MHFSASKDIDGDSGMSNSPKVDDITFLEWAGKIDRIIVHTINDKYYATGPLKFWLNVLKNSGHKFVLVDRHNAVNALNAVWIDTSPFKRVCFEKGSCSMNSTKKYNEILNELLSYNPNIIVGPMPEKKWSAT